MFKGSFLHEQMGGLMGRPLLEGKRKDRLREKKSCFTRKAWDAEKARKTNKSEPGVSVRMLQRHHSNSKDTGDK